MLSNVFVRLVSSIRPVKNYQHQFLRLLSSAPTESSGNQAEMSSTNRESGVVKRFSKEKGYGFISKTNDGTDYFVHFKNINTEGFKKLEQGQEVEFTSFQGEKGPEARDVNILGSGASRQTFFDNSSKSGFGRRSRNPSSAFEFGGGGGGGRSSRYQSDNEGERTFDMNTDSSTDDLFSGRREFGSTRERQMGSVKRWSADRGFGFIRRTNGGPDLFCHVRSLRSGVQALEEGQTVQYRIQQTDKGEEARDVTIFQEDASNADPTERQTGTVKRWIPDRNYGFLQPNQGGPDVFVHIRELPEGTTSLTEGQIVEFNIKSGGKGATAENVTVQDQS